MWNPFKAIASGIGKAVSGVGKGIGGALSKAGGAMSKAGDKMSGKSAPKSPPTPPAAPPQRRVTIPVERPPAAPPAPTKKLPPSMTGGNAGGRGAGGMAIDEGILGADSDAERDLNEAIKDFEADNSLLGLSREARDFLAHPSYAAIFEKYAPGGGFAPDQWVAGMKDPHNFRITRTGNQIDIVFDGDFDMGGDYDLGGRSPYATF